MHIIVGEVDSFEDDLYLMEADEISLWEGDNPKVVVEDGAVPGEAVRKAKVATQTVSLQVHFILVDDNHFCIPQHPDGGVMLPEKVLFQDVALIVNMHQVIFPPGFDQQHKRILTGRMYFHNGIIFVEAEVELYAL